MNERIEAGFMAFTANGSEGIGAVRSVERDRIVIYVENAGEFTVPVEAVTRVHMQKVMLNPEHFNRALRIAIKRAHDAEDPNLAG